MQGSFSRNKLTVDELMPSGYEELRRLVYRYLIGKKAKHTLRPTAMVNEAYLKLAGQHTEWHDKSKFLAVAASAMRHILVDHARAQGHQKRKLRQESHAQRDGCGWRNRLAKSATT
jgi:RNA polymerase sigma factor (TIGR02999 family)